MADPTDPKPTPAAQVVKYLPWAIAFASWLVLAVPFVLGRTDAPPPPPPVLPMTQPLVVVVGTPGATLTPPAAVPASK